MRGHDNLSVNDQMEDLRERMRLLQGDRKVREAAQAHACVHGMLVHVFILYGPVCLSHITVVVASLSK